jgi:GT2 family glycosyltransferase
LETPGITRELSKWEPEGQPQLHRESPESNDNRLRQGNSYWQNQRWKHAIKAYVAAIWENPLISLPVVHLLEASRHQYQRERSKRLHNHPNDATIVRVLEEISWTDANKTKSERPEDKDPVLLLPRKSKRFVYWCWQRVVEMPADCVILHGRSMPLVVAGLLYKLTWNAVVLESHSTKPEENNRSLKAISIDQLKTQRHGLPDPQILEQDDWQRLAIGLMARFDGAQEGRQQPPWHVDLHNPRRPVDGAQLNCLEALEPTLASPLMAARFWRWNHERINWSELQKRPRDSNLVSIVIPAYGDAGELEACLHSLRATESALHWEALVVMNDGSPPNREAVARHSSNDQRIRAIWPGENVQFALGCNLGFAASEGHWLVLLNNDCRVSNDWLDHLIAPLHDEAVAASQPRLVKPDGTVQSLGVVFHRGQTLGYPLYAGLSANTACVQKPHRLQALTGACLALRAHDYAAVGGLDCRYINSQEDIDLCLRLLKIAGRRYCLSCPNIEVVHAEARSPGRFSHSLWSRHQFVRRWAAMIKPDDAAIYQADGMEITSFKPDQPSLERQGIGAGRARVHSSRDGMTAQV